MPVFSLRAGAIPFLLLALCAALSGCTDLLARESNRPIPGMLTVGGVGVLKAG